jgi:hypothetical protein
MKKYLLTLFSVLVSVTLMGQNPFTIGSLTYTIISGTNNVKVKKMHQNDNFTNLVIPSTVVNGNTTYTVTEIADDGFKNTNSLTSVTFPNTLTTIGSNAFSNCFPNSNTGTTLYFPPSLEKIEASAFSSCNGIKKIYITSDVTIETNNFEYYNHITAYVLGDITWPAGQENPFGNEPDLINVPCDQVNYYKEMHTIDRYKDAVTCDDIYTTIANGNFNTASTWDKNSIPGNDDFFVIDGHTVTLNHTLQVQPYKALNKGVLRIEGNGQLIDNGTGNTPSIGGEIEVVTPATQGRWNFVGAPFNGYDLYAMKLGPGNTDATVVEFDYGTNDWSMNYSYANTNHIIGAGEGFFAWPFYSGGITFSTKRDYSTPNSNTTTQNEAPVFALNNGNVEVQKAVTGDASTGRWMALSNPYPAKLSIRTFISNNSSKIQGGCIYILSNNLQDNSTYQRWVDVHSNEDGDLNVGQGFFVNIQESQSGTITFTKTQLTNYNGNQTQSKAESEKEFIRFAMIEGERESEVLFAHNQDAQEGYDIFDANKLFAMSHIAEPYFVVDGISLVKEEVNLLPYYATMNVKSFGNKEVKFSPKYIPEGLSVTLIDGEESIDLLQGQEYATEISAGENANRFKLLIKKSLGLSDAEELEVNISNDNRIVNIATSETDLQIEVYNALGQKVFETKALNFSLNNVSAGAYMIKAFNNKASKTQKIVVK